MYFSKVHIKMSIQQISRLEIQAFVVAQQLKNQPRVAEEARVAGSIPESGRSSGGGNGNPLQYSCLVNPLDRGAWQTTESIDRVAKSQTQLTKRTQARNSNKKLELRRIILKIILIFMRHFQQVDTNYFFTSYSPTCVIC